jgi:hypothetical protein
MRDFASPVKLSTLAAELTFDSRTGSTDDGMYCEINWSAAEVNCARSVAWRFSRTAAEVVVLRRARKSVGYNILKKPHRRSCAKQLLADNDTEEQNLRDWYFNRDSIELMKVLRQLLDVVPRLVNNLLSIVIDGFGVETGIDSRYGSFLSQCYSENTPSSTRNPACGKGHC